MNMFMMSKIVILMMVLIRHTFLFISIVVSSRLARLLSSLAASYYITMYINNVVQNAIWTHADYKAKGVGL